MTLDGLPRARSGRGQVPAHMSRASIDPGALNSMDPEHLVDQIYRRISALPVKNTPSIRIIRNEFTRSLRQADASLVLEFARAVLAREEHRWVAYEIIHSHPAAMRRVGEAELLEFGRGIDHWWSVDPFSLELAGPAWRERQVSDEFIVGWAKSDDRWWRRASLVSTVPLNARARGGRGDTRRTLLVCERLVADRDDMVVKALSWALRALLAQDRRAVETFLSSHAAGVHPRVMREVTSKLQTGLKSPRRRGKTGDR
jgi:3-methyladenine DNA glycosylase AlkD